MERQKLDILVLVERTVEVSFGGRGRLGIGWYFQRFALQDDGSPLQGHISHCKKVLGVPRNRDHQVTVRNGAVARQMFEAVYDRGDRHHGDISSCSGPDHRRAETRMLQALVPRSRKKAEYEKGLRIDGRDEKGYRQIGALRGAG
jgi:hypothetical protein